MCSLRVALALVLALAEVVDVGAVVLSVKGRRRENGCPQGDCWGRDCLDWEVLSEEEAVEKEEGLSKLMGSDHDPGKAGVDGGGGCLLKRWEMVRAAAAAGRGNKRDDQKEGGLRYSTEEVKMVEKRVN